MSRNCAISAGFNAYAHVCSCILFFFFSWGMCLIHNQLLKRSERVCEVKETPNFCWLHDSLMNLTQCCYCAECLIMKYTGLIAAVQWI